MLDPDDARLNPRVGDVWRKGEEVRTITLVLKGHIDFACAFDRLKQEFAWCDYRSTFRRWTQTAELIERGDTDHAD